MELPATSQHWFTGARWSLAGLVTAAASLSAGCSTVATRVTESVRAVNPVAHLSLDQQREAGSYQQRNAGWRNTQQVGSAWLRSTVGDTLRRPFNTASTGVIVTQERVRELFRGNEFDLTKLPAGANVPPPGTPAFEAWLDRAGIPAAVPGRLEFVADGAFFERLEADLLAAKQSIDVQLFIWDNDEVAQHFARLVREKSEQIPVRVLVDNLATAGEAGVVSQAAPRVPNRPPANIAHFMARGYPLHLRRSPNPSFMADHTKVWVIDKQHAWFGGMNMGWEYRHEWHDLMVRAEGPVVEQLAGRFERNWTALGPVGRLGTRRKVEGMQFVASPADVPLRVLETDSSRLRNDTETALIGAMRGAQRRIWLQNSYCSSDRVLTEAVNAAKRGVDVRVLFPEATNHGMMDDGNWLTAAAIIRAGGRAWAFPGMTHVKAYVCDDWAYVGSANLDFLSLRINRELGVGVSDPATVQRLVETTFAKDFARSKEVNFEEARRRSHHPMARLNETLADQF